MRAAACISVAATGGRPPLPNASGGQINDKSNALEEKREEEEREAEVLVHSYMYMDGRF